jgi:Caspase domain
MKVGRPLRFSIIIILAGCIPPPHAAVKDATGPRPGQRSGRLALLVGINEYKAVTGLSGAVNDIHRMKTLLRTFYSFEEEDFLMLPDEKATHEAIVQAFRNHLVKNANDKSIVVFHFSGHGSQMKDKGGDEIDKLDETIVPHDSRTEGVYDITDDELNGLITELNRVTKNVTIVLDCCHSGAGTKGANFRKIPPDDREPPDEPAYARPEDRNSPYAGKLIALQDSAVIAGCLADELAYEYYDPETTKTHGTLTFFLVDQLKKAKGQEATYSDVFETVKQKVNGVYRQQHPQLEGTRADNVIFHERAKAARPYVLISEEGGTVGLEAGAVHGMTVGSALDIYPPGTKTFDDRSKLVASVELTSVSPYDSVAKRLNGGAIAPASRAIEVRHLYGKARIPVLVEDPSASTVLTRIRDRLRGQDRTDPTNPRSPAFAEVFEVTDRRDSARLIVAEETVDGGKVVSLFGGDRTRLSPSVRVGDKDVDSVAGQLTRWAKWHTVFSIDNPQPALDVEFCVEPVADPPCAANRTPVLHNKETVRFTVTNRSGKSLYIAILDLATDGSIDVTYPPIGEKEALPPNPAEPWTRSTSMFVPEGRDEVRDHFKLIATQAPVDFRALRQEGIKGLPKGDVDPLLRLLGESMFIERNSEPIEARIDGWVSKVRAVDVRRTK